MFIETLCPLRVKRSSNLKTLEGVFVMLTRGPSFLKLSPFKNVPQEGERV